jgi:hypothetical protein
MALCSTVPSQRLDGVALIIFNAIRSNAHIIMRKILLEDKRVPLNDSPPYLLFQSGDRFLSPDASLLLLRPSGTAQRQRKDETINPNPIQSTSATCQLSCPMLPKLN